MTLSPARQIGKPNGDQVFVSRIKGGKLRVADEHGENIRTVLPTDIEDAAMKVLGLPEHEDVPRIIGETLAYAALSQNSFILAADNDAPKPENSSAAGASAAQSPAAEPKKASAAPLAMAANVPTTPPGNITRLRDDCSIEGIADAALKLARLHEEVLPPSDLLHRVTKLTRELFDVPASALHSAVRHLVESLTSYAQSGDSEQFIWAFKVATDAHSVRALLRWNNEGRRK